MRSKPNDKSHPGIFPLVAVLLVASSPSTLGGPHHFQKWTEGEIVDTDVNAHQLKIRSSGSSVDTRLKWDTSTVLFKGNLKKPLSAGQIHSDSLHKGEQVRVLYQLHGHDLIVKRIVTESAGSPAAKN